MTKRKAQQAWQEYVTSTAQAWLVEFNDEPLDPEWSATGYQEIETDVIQALDIADPWITFHREVQEAIEDMLEPGGTTRD